MGFFQSAGKKIRCITGCAVFFAVFAAGCATQKTENINTAEKAGLAAQQTVDQSSDSQGVQNQGKQVLGIETRQTDEGMEVWLLGSEKLEYTSIKQDFPFAIAVYLPGTGFSNQIVIPEFQSGLPVGGIKTGFADEKKTTAKIEILLTRNISYQVRQNDGQLGFILPFETLAAQEKPLSMTDSSGGSNSSSQPVVRENDSQPASSPAIVPDRPAVMTQIEFNTPPSGRSDIRIETSHPVRYETFQTADNKMNLVLYNTKLPAHHQRPLLTQYFKSAVERIIPKPSSNEGADTRIEIITRDQVPFRIVQNQNILTMAFEPSDIQPPDFTKAQKKLSSGKVDQYQVSTPAVSGDAVPAVLASQKASQVVVQPDIPGNSPKVYTGEKIKLDFFETDIKNVFRILRSVSGMNFAIDKDVQGKVTLALDEPVPWDQVLDLVLKMNRLGKKMEGNVVRIATIDTLKDEEQIIQDAIAAKKKTMEQQKSFEPLVTEYIPINYSDAQADIQPHVQQILTEGRGRLSVDPRTNMIILTDTQAKIDQAHEIIFRLDTVTPQIVIEAKVVEVTKEFSRNLGVSWNLSNDPSITSGFVNDFNIAINQPQGSGLNMDFSFFRLFGSSVAALNAQLEASEQQGDAKIISSPRILTLDNKKAKIKQGQEYAYLERDDSGGSSVKYKDIDLLLEVTPHVTPDKRIGMTVYITKNDVVGIEDTSGAPILNTNEAETELLVNNNDTVVIGGIVKTTNVKGDSGIPYMTGIPVLGTLFGTTTDEDKRNELLIFITPTIVQLEQKRFVKSPNK